MGARWLLAISHSSPWERRETLQSSASMHQRAWFVSNAPSSILRGAPPPLRTALLDLKEPPLLDLKELALLDLKDPPRST